MRSTFFITLILLITATLPSWSQTAPIARIGLGEPVIENAIHKQGWTVDGQMDRIIGLKPALFRLWFPAGYLYNDKGVRDNSFLPLFRRAVDRLHQSGIQIMGMDHSFPAWMTGAMVAKNAAGADVNWNTIPCRETPAYQTFLSNYEKHWHEMIKLFPEVVIWEPANETNAATSLKPIQAGVGSCNKVYFTIDERVMITIELMERAHRAVAVVQSNRAIKERAQIFLPPPSPMQEVDLVPNLKNIEVFIAKIYKAIASWNGNARSYFDGVSWHPYIFEFPTYQNWVQPNKSIHHIMAQYGDEKLPVIFSEIGNSEKNYNLSGGGTVDRSPEELALWMNESMRLVQNQTDFSWLSHVVWFRAFDDQSALSWGGETEVKFGIMKDNFPIFTSKPSADTFCKFSGCAAGR